MPEQATRSTRCPAGWRRVDRHTQLVQCHQLKRPGGEPLLARHPASVLQHRLCRRSAVAAQGCQEPQEPHRVVGGLIVHRPSWLVNDRVGGQIGVPERGHCPGPQQPGPGPLPPGLRIPAHPGQLPVLVDLVERRPTPDRHRRPEAGQRSFGPSIVQEFVCSVGQLLMVPVALLLAGVMTWMFVHSTNTIILDAEKTTARQPNRTPQKHNQTLAWRVQDIIAGLELTQTDFNIAGGRSVHIPEVVSVAAGPPVGLHIRTLPGQTPDNFAAHAPAIAYNLGVAEVRVVPLGPSLIRLALLPRTDLEVDETT